jgi:hypothetical protein
MRRFISKSLNIVLPGIVLLLISCNQGSCFEETESYLKATFYSSTTKKIAAPAKLTVSGLNDTTKIYSKAINISHADFPLNASEPSCIFLIIIDGVTDTLEFKYDTYPHLISKECGYTYHHTLDSAYRPTFHAIDSIKLINKTVTNLNVENIRIYY